MCECFEVKHAILNADDVNRIRAAMRWFELKDFVSASKELDEIRPKARMHPEVLRIRYAIYYNTGQWEFAADISRVQTINEPEGKYWFRWASDTSKTAAGIPEAIKILIYAQTMFPTDFFYPYHIACYYSQLGEFEEAKRWLKKGLAINNKVFQGLAENSPSLKPLLDSMTETI